MSLSSKQTKIRRKTWRHEQFLNFISNSSLWGKNISKLVRNNNNKKTLFPYLQNRQKSEEKREEASKLLTSTSASYASELERLRQAVSDGKTRIDILNHQLTQMERERSLVEVDNKNLKRRLEVVVQDDVKLKEEVCLKCFVYELMLG